MALEIDAARDASSDLAALLPFPSAPEEDRQARAAVLEAYLGSRGAEAASSGGGGGGAAPSGPLAGGPSRGSLSAAAFPGPNPISMDVDTHLPAVMREAYVVSAKVDGTRFQLVCMLHGGGGGGEHTEGDRAPLLRGTPTVVLVDRTMRCFTPTYFSLPDGIFDGVNGGSGREGACAVLDAELAEVRGRGLELFVFDAVVLGGSRSVATLPYSRRWAAMAAAIAGGELGFGASTLIPLRPKPIYAKHRARELMMHPERFLGPGISADGVVLTPEADPVRTFRHWRMFKVKEKHTIDMRLVLVPKQPLRAFTNPILAMPDSIVQRIRSNVFGGPASASSQQQQQQQPARGGAPDTAAEINRMKQEAAARLRNGTRAASSSLLKLLGARKRNRPEEQQSGPLAASGSLAPSPAQSRLPPPPPPPPRLLSPPPPPQQQQQRSPAASLTQWILRLEYVRGGRVLDATTDGVEYAGHRIVFQVQETPALSALIDSVERVWQRVPGDVMTMSLIAEVALSLCPADLETPGYELLNRVTVERPRPDKHEPNSFMTITRTFTSILYGVRADHLRVLEQEAAEDEQQGSRWRQQQRQQQQQPSQRQQQQQPSQRQQQQQPSQRQQQQQPSQRQQQQPSQRG
jgi:hypothetical protein